MARPQCQQVIEPNFVSTGLLTMEGSSEHPAQSGELNPNAASGLPPGLGIEPQVNGTTPSMQAPNLFWSERQQEEFRLQQARPGFLEEEVLTDNGANTVLRPPEIAARDIPVRDDEADQELHPPYEREAQVIADDVSTRHIAGGSMLRRTTNAIREARDQSPVVPATTAFGSTAENGEVRLQQSPDRDSISTAGLNQPSRAAEPFQVQLDQHDSYVYGLRVSAVQNQLTWLV